MMHASIVALVLAALASACAAPVAEALDAGPPGVADDLASDASPAGTTPGEPGAFRRCVDHPFTPAPAADWRHTRSALVVAAGAPNHAAGDVFALPGTTPYVGAKLTYGALGKDLEDEDVIAFVDTCAGWQRLGQGPTDDDGRVKVRLPPLATGVYEVRFQVAGDRGTASAWAYVLPAGTHLVVTDVDGTLTRSDRELFAQVLDGSHVPVPYPDAAALIDAHVANGQVAYYLTGRPYWLSRITRAWLAEQGFPRGPLRVTDATSDSLPTEDSVGAFKRARLAELVALGYVIDAAYGNATTDISAYLAAGVAPERVWIIGDHAGEQGTHAVRDAWTDRAREVAVAGRVAQPFAW